MDVASSRSTYSTFYNRLIMALSWSDGIHQLPKEYIDEALKLHIDEIHVAFSGGNDEGYCHVAIESAYITNESAKINREAQRQINHENSLKQTVPDDDESVKSFTDYKRLSDLKNDLRSKHPVISLIESFREKIYDWAIHTYHYSGAGDGSDYGDDINYDIKNREIKWSEWHMDRIDTKQQSIPIPPTN